MNTIRETIRSAVKEFIQVPDDIQRLCNLATSDLLYGPLEDSLDDSEIAFYKSYNSAIGRIREWAYELPGDLWIDLDCGSVSTREPEAEEIDGEVVEVVWDSIYHLSGVKQVAEILLNSTVAEYL